MFKVPRMNFTRVKFKAVAYWIPLNRLTRRNLLARLNYERVSRRWALG